MKTVRETCGQDVDPAIAHLQTAAAQIPVLGARIALDVRVDTHAQDIESRRKSMQPVKRPIAGIAQRIIWLGPFSSGDVVRADAQTPVEQFVVERPQALFLQTFALDQRGKPPTARKN